MSIKQDGFVIGVDLGGTKMLAAAVGPGGSLLDKREIATEPDRGTDDVLRRLEELVSGMGERTGLLHGIGVATAGTLDADRGTVLQAANLGWTDVPLGPRLQERFGCPVTVENDANAAAYGEWTTGSGKGTEHFVYVTVSTGIGAGIVSGGRLIRGASNSAAELGHITIDWRGPACPCGNVGCLELYASGTAIARAAAAEVRRGGTSSALLAQLVGGDAGRMTAKQVSAAAAQGDGLALDILREAGEALGAGLASIVHVANPELIAIGGGAANIGQPLLGPMRAAFEARCIPSMAKNVRITPTALDGEAGVIGAALLSLGSLQK